MRTVFVRRQKVGPPGPAGVIKKSLQSDALRRCLSGGQGVATSRCLMFSLGALELMDLKIHGRGKG